MVYFKIWSQYFHLQLLKEQDAGTESRKYFLCNLSQNISQAQLYSDGNPMIMLITKPESYTEFPYR